MRFTASILSLPMLLVGCSEVDDGVSLSLSVAEYVGNDDPGIPLQDVDVCETDTSNCVMTDALGRTTLTFPRDAEIS